MLCSPPSPPRLRPHAEMTAEPTTAPPRGIRPDIRSMPPVRLDSLSRESLREYFANAWELYELLFGAIGDEATLYESPDPLRNPLIFYLGHTAAFYVNKLRLAGALAEGFDERFEELFAVGVDPESADELERFSWPPVAAVRDYRRRVFRRVAEWIESAEIRLPVTPADEPLWALLMGIEHDRIHFETSSVLIRQLASVKVRCPPGWRYAPADGGSPGGDPAAVPAGTIELGKPPGFPTFGWDNEYGRRTVEVAAFEAQPDLVTNREFLEFVADGGYTSRALWTDEGWLWRREAGARHPRFWVAEAGGFRYRAMFDELELPLAWPVEVNCHEARAFCRWRGEGWRLPSEAEYRRAAEGCPLVDGDSISSDAYNLNLAYGSPSPVGSFPAGNSPRGLRDVYGNVWQWLADDFTPLEGFAPHRLYADFSAPFFDDQHAMLLGGSWASTGTSGSRFYRLWFRRNFFQHAGFRMVRSPR